MMAKVRVNALILALLPENLSSDLVTVQRILSFGRFNIRDLKASVIQLSKLALGSSLFFILVRRGRTRFGQHQASRPLGRGAKEHGLWEREWVALDKLQRVCRRPN